MMFLLQKLRHYQHSAHAEVTDTFYVGITHVIVLTNRILTLSLKLSITKFEII